VKKNEFIKQIRQKYKMSQKKFAEYLEVSKSLIEKVEMGKIPATPENKYVKAVCALEGLDNEIFKYDEITDEILKEYELSKFSKAFRKFLYFYYGTFYPNRFAYDYFIQSYINSINNAIVHLEMENFSVEGEFYGGDWREYWIRNFPKELLFENLNYLTLPKIKQTTDIKLLKLFEIFTIISINTITENLKFGLINFNDNPYSYIEFLKNFDFKAAEELYGIINLSSVDKFYLIELISEFSELDTQISVENIKKLKKIKEIEQLKRKEEFINAFNVLDEFFDSAENNKNQNIKKSTDPKDKQICELLQYAPPAFKDKIIEKLLKFKDEVEDI